MAPHEQLLRQSYAAFNARDARAATDALAVDVEWPDQLEGGTMHGPRAVGAYWERQWLVLSPMFEIKHVEEDSEGHTVVTLLQTVHGRDGQPISQGLVRHVYEFKAGLVKRMRVLL